MNQQTIEALLKCFVAAVIGAGLYFMYIMETRAHGFPYTSLPTHESRYAPCSINLSFYELVKLTEPEGESCSSRQVMSYVDHHQIYDAILINPSPKPAVQRALVCEPYKRIQRCGVPAFSNCDTLKYIAQDEQALSLIPIGFCAGWTGLK